MDRELLIMLFRMCVTFGVIALGVTGAGILCALTM